MANVLGKVHTINARETTFFNANRTYDRIITDIPSFENRWPGTQGAGEVIDNVNAVIHVMNNKWHIKIILSTQQHSSSFIFAF